VGILTGHISRIVVVDVDLAAGGDPVEILRKWPTGRVVKTPGGFHLYYLHPGKSVPNGVGVYGDGVDVRGDGGLVVAPPTTTDKGEYVWESEDTAGKVPPWAVTHTREGVQEDSDDRSWLSTLLAGTDKGERNQSCARIAGYLLKKRIPEDVAQAILLGWNYRNKKPLEEVEIHKTVHSIYKGRRVDELDKRCTDPWLESLHDLGLRMGDRPIQWLVEDWLPASTVAFTVSPPGSYKTWLVLELAAAVATGTKFLGIATVHDPGPVLVFQQEDASSMLIDRMALLLASRYDTGFEMQDETISISLPGRPPIWFHTRRELRFNDTESLHRLAESVREKEAKLVIIDPLYMAAGTADGYMQETAQQMSILKDLRDQYGTTFMIVHHTRKTTGGTGGRLDAWGSQFLNAFLETGWQVRPVQYKQKGTDTMSPPTSGIEVYRHFKAGASDTKSIYLSWEIDGDGVAVHVAEDVEMVRKLEMEKRTTDEMILSLIQTPNRTTLVAKSCKLSPSQTTRRLQALVEKAWAIKTKDNRWLISPRGAAHLEGKESEEGDLL
jgi:hypothetical protein